MKPVLFDTKSFTEGLNIHKKYHKDKHYEVAVERLLEEMAELTKELLKERRGKTERGGKPIKETIKDEFADVLLCLEYLARMNEFTLEEILARVSNKSVKVIGNLS